MKYPFQKEIKVAFLSENPTHQFTDEDRSQHHARTDFAWMVSLNACNYNIKDLVCGRYFENKWDKFDIIIYIPPKNSPDTTYIFDIKKQFPKIKIGIQQEGPSGFYKSYSIPVQIAYIKMLTEVDFILCHNQIDVGYYQAFNNQVFIMPSLMIEDNIKDLKKVEDSNIIIIGGGCSEWYGGMDSYIVARTMMDINPDLEIWMPQMGRNNGEEEKLGIKVLPHSDWLSWMKNLSKCKYAIHMMPTLAAGTFQLNCAYLGIPCIGTYGTDTQNICHSNTSGDNLITAVRLGKLILGESYYRMSENTSKNRYGRFSEQRWIMQMESNFNKILGE